jgi:phosphoglycerate kinase
VGDKIPLIENLLNKADDILIGGAMAYTFLKSQGKDVGKSLVEDDKLDIARDILKRAVEYNVNFLLPLDHVLAAAIDAGAETEVVESLPFPAAKIGVDIGPKTVAAYAKIIAGAKTIVWNGPLGVFEIDKFAKGTLGIAAAVAASGAISVVGGGDSVAAVKKAGVTDKISHISTGGGASLEFLAFETLPGIDALED